MVPPPAIRIFDVPDCFVESQNVKEFRFTRLMIANIFISQVASNGGRLAFSTFNQIANRSQTEKLFLNVELREKKFLDLRKSFIAISR